MGQTNSEDTLLFIALSSKAIKKKNLYDGLEEFANKKLGIDPSDRFNIIIFTQSGPAYLEDFTFDFNNIIDALNEYRDSRVKSNIAGGIFVAATFIIDVFKKISDKVFRLLILIDKNSVKISDQYFLVLKNLVEKVKDIPFIIDVIHLGQPHNHKNLERLVEFCGGKVYEVATRDEFHETLLQLAEKHRLDYNKSLTVFQKDKAFYENLADNVEILKEPETCSICFKETDETLFRCPNCKTIAHMSCWANWAKTRNIGMPHLFRCHNCFNLLKLDEEYAKIVQKGEEPPAEIRFEARDITSYLREQEDKERPQIVSVEDPLAMPEDKENHEEEISPEFTQSTGEDRRSHARPLPRSTEERSGDPNQVDMVICPVCSAINRSSDIKCYNCGNRLEK
ncbi:MAG: hypothetical protein R6U96_04425 [Promethearchaeia archaeon]